MVAILKLNNGIKIFFQKYVLWGLTNAPSFKSTCNGVVNIKGFFENPQTKGKISEIGNTFVGTFFLVFM